MSHQDVEPDSEHELHDEASGLLESELTEYLIIQNCPTAVKVEFAGRGQSAGELVIDSDNQTVCTVLVESVQTKSGPIAATNFYAKRKTRKPSRYAN